MVDAPRTQPDSSEQPFAIKAAVFTVVFLIIILGVIPSCFFVAEHWNSGSDEIAGHNLAVQVQVVEDLPATDAKGFFAHMSARAAIFWPEFLRLVGISIFTTGLMAYLACSAWLIFYGRGPHVEFDPPKVFVATGPYRWVRNPVVLALLVTVVGEAIYFASWGIFILVLLGCIFAQLQVTKMEEPRLRARFGESYEEFCRRVPRWIPRPPRDL